ncbi:Hypothetical protein AA314_01393 [Archangium gephyra]|uniref:Uncharacterized protein n=1 Tax=Archangium gephyra TaxID=48 RepID=A0AAC8Q2P2_9BACT|nr:Hypothetical protein AA314_01393 [Archangium gephyra]
MPGFLASAARTSRARLVLASAGGQGTWTGVGGGGTAPWGEGT